MKARIYNPSPEYIDSLCEAMIEWANKPDSLTVPQFLATQDLGYPFLKYFVECSNKVCNAFEQMKNILHTRWVHMAMKESKTAAAKGKAIMRYMRLYDSHGLDVEFDFRKDLADQAIYSEMKYTLENYAHKELSGPTKKNYEANVNKRRDSEEAQ